MIKITLGNKNVINDNFLRYNNTNIYRDKKVETRFFCKTLVVGTKRFLLPGIPFNTSENA